MPTQATTNNDSPPGFRLQRLEVRNWGTFHEKIHILDPAGQTALLLGENGSGKSTLVDALLTLLVPKIKRNYNLSAGGAKKRERDEKTYVLGAYGSKSDSDESRAQTKYLRKAGGSPSILLAAFRNDATGEGIGGGAGASLSRFEGVLGGHPHRKKAVGSARTHRGKGGGDQKV
jgi:uncharacterized protein YPO0396